MKRKSLVDVVRDDLLDRIINGDIAVGEALPSEPEIAKNSNVSRLTVREALKSLRAQNIVEVRRGRGTFVNPTNDWTDLEAMLRVAARGTGSEQVALRLLEVRGMVETGAAELAAKHHSQADLLKMDTSIAQMETAHARDDLDSLVLADLAFHDAVFRASRNPFIPVLLGQLGQLLYVMRRETSAFREVQEHAIQHHKKVREAIATGVPQAARGAMEAHIEQTFADYERYISSQRAYPKK